VTEGTPPPDLIIVYGSETRLLSGLYDKPIRFIRIYNKTRPTPRPNCRDLDGIQCLHGALADERSRAEGRTLRIAFIGAAFKAQGKLFLAESTEDIDRTVSVNISNYVHLVQAILPHMVASKYGSFIYLSSFRAAITTKGVSLYSASKAFGEKFFEVIGKEYGRLNISAVSIRMGYFDGRMLDAFTPEKASKIKKRISMNRLGRSDELLSAIEFALQNRYLSGGVIDLSGGIDFD
jgi:NAD(P)-dependent dehydrogenase (short-subunit alcohol dehydrogenase family)